ncbi:DUF3857 domain-containing protein [Flavobacterium sp. 20NA77.7]|uniref:DUF3857 domain-containing protein n=1 Tax=Flavobacterium nakdongensis TaxID=3073563 RepID=A0ABY9R8L9_9FLAO|nr:DUF3857 domain-containing protein [Flavobacterium sp. 20NA77.7]WMW77504.1 DUF3857 domain-containing protein [Flavobacterium sp. 20NA77.7]
MKKLILLVLFPIFVLAQKFELGNVTIEELKEKVHPTDSSAVAAILFTKGKSYFEFVENSHFILITEVEIKIKIYKKEGYEWANNEVSYYIGGHDDESVQFSKAFTYNLVNGKIEKTKLNSENEFKEVVNKYWETKKISMPNVKEGSIIEFKYIVKTPYYSNLHDWKFQSTIPVNYSEYITNIPEYYTYNYFSRGAINITVEKSDRSRTINIYDKELAARGANISYQNTSSSVGYTDNITKMYVSNVPAFKIEPFTNNINNYMSCIEYELASTKFPNSEIKFFSESWEDVTKNIYKNEQFGLELEKDNYFETDLNQILSDKSLDSPKKIEKILEFVKNNVKWNEYNSITVDKGVTKAYKEKTGNTAEVNFILISMLRKAGFDANPVVLTTRSKPINLFPSRTAFNYVVCGIETDNDVILLDATDKNSKIDVLPTRALNYIGRIIRENGTSSQIDLTPKKPAKESTMVFAALDEKGNVTGTIKEQLFERAAFVFRDRNASVSDENYLDKYEKDNPGFEISDYKITNKLDPHLPISKEYQFTNTNASEIINDKIYFKPLMHFGFEENPFKLETRDYPVDFIAPFHDSYTMSYTLPVGYMVESLPTQLNLQMIDNLGSFSYLIADNVENVQIVCNFKINVPLVSNEYYDVLKEFFNQVQLKMNEKIILKKK